MCRYAFRDYKPHYACFKCRKTFKRKHLFDADRDNETSVEAKCPQCQSLMGNMGLDFESPKMKDEKAWEHLEQLYSVGITFHSCGCQGPGYIPNDKEMLIKYYDDKIFNYNKELVFWRKRIEPTNQSEVQKEINQHKEKLWPIPSELRDKKTGIVKNEDAINFWIERIKLMEEKLKIIK